MRDLTKLLRDADPVREDESLTAGEWQSMRRAVLAAVVDGPVAVPFWQHPLRMAAAIALTIIVGIVGGRVMLDRESNTSPVVSADRGSSGTLGGDRLQLQFSTPGGTRIIWIFDQNLRLQESMP